MEARCGRHAPGTCNGYGTECVPRHTEAEILAHRRDSGWAGTGFTGPPADPDPSELRLALRRQMRLQGTATLADLESIFLGRGSRWHRNDLIETMAAMRDDGEIRFHGPRYVWNG